MWPGELVLWGATLWDPRVPALLHTFDQLSAAGGTGGCFHPGGSEIVLNSEVNSPGQWDCGALWALKGVLDQQKMPPDQTDSSLIGLAFCSNKC
jgi:hypothetical protein